MILLSPGLESNLLLQQHEKKGLEFFCYCNNYANCRIELWSNMNKEKEWTSFPMTPMGNSQHYKVIVHTFHLLPGDYEFTLRFTTSGESWSWYGKPGNNGRVRILPRSIPNSINIHSFSSQFKLADKQYINGVQLWHYQTQHNLDKGERSLSLESHPVHHYVALIRKGSSWLTPVCGSSNFDKHSEHEKWQLLLYQDSTCGDIHLWMAIGQNVDCWLSPGSNSNLTLNMRSSNHNAANLFICSTQKKQEYTRLIKVALDYYRKFLKGEKEKEISTSRQFSQADTETLDTLGYCTWNAFGKAVSETNLHQAMESLKSNNIPVAYMIIDDGWQDVLNNKLFTEDTNKDKFPGGLKGTVADLKSQYPQLKRVGVWHALWGYWDGVHSDFKKNFEGIKMRDHEGKDLGVMTKPDDFYKSLYSHLQHAGVDFVKVDNQSAFQGLVDTSVCGVDVYKLWDKYRKAVIKYADKYLECGVRHCMSLTPHVLFEEILSTMKVSIFRSSDDYFPDEQDSHAWHIYANAINALLLSQYPVVSDWDMFQSDHPFAEYHATSRAISGGPVYITDVSNKHNTELIQKLVAQTRNNEYTILRSAQVALPAFDTVFGNTMEHKNLICLYNTHVEEEPQSKDSYGYIVCGFWNTGSDDKLGVVSSSKFRSDGLAPLLAYVVSGPEKERCIRLKPYAEAHEDDNNPPSFTSSSHHAMSVLVPGLSSSLVSLSPIRTLGILSVACLGLVDKFNSTRPIIRTAVKKENSSYALYQAFLSHKSRQCGFWISTANTRGTKSFVIPQRITLDNQELIPDKNWTFNKETGILCVDMTVVDIKVSSSQNNFHIKIHFMQDVTT